MIVEFRVKNFLSFRDEVVLSFEADKDPTLENYYVVQTGGFRLLKLGMIYGPNASGKTNIIQALNFFSNLLFATRKSKDESTGFIPFMLGDTDKEPGSFTLVFVMEDIKYVYSITLDEHTIYEEKLDAYYSHQPSRLFKRYFDKQQNMSVIHYGPKLKPSKAAEEAIELNALKNVTFFAAYDQVNYSMKVIETVKSWFTSYLMPIVSPRTNLKDYTTGRLRNNEKLKTFVLALLQEADFNISDLDLEEESHTLNERMINLLIESEEIPEEERKRLKKEGTITRQRLQFAHRVSGQDSPHYLLEDLESNGTMRFYGLAGPLYELVNGNHFMAIDEFESSLHPDLMQYVIKLFLEKSGRSQLLFTTHNISLLAEKDLLRKDAIWFTEKNDYAVTDLYSLADFNFRKKLSFYNAYKLGKFGAIPDIEE